MTTPTQNQSSIKQLREAVSAQLTEPPHIPLLETVKELGLAYLGDMPDTYRHAKRELGPTGWSLNRLTLMSRSIRTEKNEEYLLQLVTTTTHDKRPYAPPIAMLGSLAFESESYTDPQEELRIWTPTILLEYLDLNPTIQRPTQHMAEALLRLPEEV